MAHPTRLCGSAVLAMHSVLLLLVLLWASNSVNAQGADFTRPWANPNITFDPDSMTLSTSELDQNEYQAHMNLANGYFGISSAAEGPFFSGDKNLSDASGPPPINGWPLDDPRVSFATIAGFWDSQKNTTRTNFPELLARGGESVISGIPHWSDLLFTTSEGQTFMAGVSNKTISNFNSSMNMRDALATWSLTWTPITGGCSFNITYQLFLDQSEARPNSALVKLDIVSSADHNGTVTDILDGRSALRTTFVAKAIEENNEIWTAVQPNGLNVTAYVFSALNSNSNAFNQSSRALALSRPYVSTNESTIAQEFNVHLKAGEVASFVKSVGVASSDAYNATAQVARAACRYGLQSGWDAALEESKSQWHKKFNSDHVEDFRDANGTLSDYWKSIHITTVATQFFLLQNLPWPSSPNGANDKSVSVGGLYSDSYAGQVFWDADVFMSPAVLSTSPEYALSIARYRIDHLEQARENAVSYGIQHGAIFPWTSARFGNCTATGPCVDYEYHINGDIFKNLFDTYLATGNKTWLMYDALPVMLDVSSMYSQKLTFNETTKKWELKNMTDPDEYANHVDNGAFTMRLIKHVFKTINSVLNFLGFATVSAWGQQADALTVPEDAATGITLEFETMNNSVVVKQADVVLLSYPLQPENKTQALANLEWYAEAQSPDGPAMTFASYQVSAAQLSPSGCSSLTYMFNAYEPYVRAPWFQFSEQIDDNVLTNGGTNPAYPFLTGHGGQGQMSPFGWLGFRAKIEGMYVSPVAVPHLEKLKIRNIVYNGATFRPVINATHTTITRIPTVSKFLVDANATITVINGNANDTTIQVAVNQTITIENRTPHLVKTVPGDFLQCMPVSTSDPYVPGQIPEAAVDGANSTKWQPKTPDAASFIIDLGPTAQTANNAFFNWGGAPPKKFNITTASSLDGPFTEVYASDNITISDPASEIAIFVIQPKIGNTTSAVFSAPVQLRRFVKLTIEGTQGPKNTTGATVAEFVLRGADGARIDVQKRWIAEAGRAGGSFLGFH